MRTLIIVIVLVLVLLFGVFLINKRAKYRKNQYILSELQRLSYIAGPNDTIYIRDPIDFNIEGYTLIGKGCTIDFTHPEMAGPDGIRLVQSGIINLEGTAGVTIKDCTFEDIDPNGVIKIEGENGIKTKGITIKPVYFTCPPECRCLKVLFKPDPVTLKREVGAVAEVTGEWFCAGCGCPLKESFPAPF